MKKIKITLVLFLLTCITSLVNIKADSYLGFAGVTLPAGQGIFTSTAVNKKTMSEQYISKTGAIDKLSGDERAIGARIQGVSTYVTVPKGSYAKLDSGDTGLGLSTVAHKLQLRANKWTVSSVSFSGIWYLDDYLMQ